MKNLKTLFLTTLVTISSVIAQPIKKISLFKEKAVSSTVSKKTKSKSIQLDLDQSTLQKLYETQPNEFEIEIPRANHKMKKYTLKRYKVTSDNFTVKTSDDKVYSGKEFTGVQYRVIDPKKRKKKTVGGFTVTKDDVMGYFQDNNKNINISKLGKSKKDFVVSDEDETPVNKTACETPDLVAKDITKNGNVIYETVKPETFDFSKYEVGESVGGEGCKKVLIYLECDFKMYQDNGSSVQATVAKATAMFALTKQLYDNEGIMIELSSVFVWTTQDPYFALTSAYSCLYDFAIRRGTGTTGPGIAPANLGMLLSTRNSNFGGVAYIDVLCSTAANFGYSNIYNTFDPNVQNYSWTVYCMAHEFGHMFGSRHTHWCGWNLGNGRIGRIDSCAAGESSSMANIPCTSSKRITRGTIMSYCHINGTVDFNLGFGPLPGAKMRSSYAAMNCATGTTPPYVQIIGPTPSTRVVGQTLELYANTLSGGSYSWTGPSSFTSTSRTPSISNVSASRSGTYNVTAVQNSCTSNVAKKTIKVYPVVSLPQTVNFLSNATFPPTDWEVRSPRPTESFYTIKRAFTTSSLNGIMHFGGWFDSQRVTDTLFSPVYTVAGSNITLTMDISHALRNTTSTRYDSVEVYIITNQRYPAKLVYKKGGLGLATASVVASGSYLPTSQTTGWRKETIDLSSYDTSSHIQYGIVYKTANNTNSNNFFLNNISLGGNASSAIKAATITVDSTTNRDKAYTLTVAIPSTHNATSYEVYQGTTIISSGNLGDNNSSSLTINRTNVSNGTYTHNVKLINSTSSSVSNNVTVTVNYVLPQLLTGTLAVDSTTNRDKNYRLTFTVPQNHNATSYQILQGTTIISSGSLANNNSTSIVLNRTNLNNGTYVHTARLINSTNTTTSNSVSVVVNFVDVILDTPVLTADSLTNLDKNYTLNFTLKNSHNGKTYEIYENSSLVSTGTLPNNNIFSLSYPLTNKSNGTYTYQVKLINGTKSTLSNSISVVVNYTPPQICSPTVLTATNVIRETFRYRFNLNPLCQNNGYRVLFYRCTNNLNLNSSDSTLTIENVKLLGLTPTGGSLRNVGSGSNVLLTTTEINQGFFERVASPPPSFRNFWYRIDVICTTCTLPNKVTTLYVFVK
jgi:hypothetical protein